jgi:hypothetical protein
LRNEQQKNQRQFGRRTPLRDKIMGFAEELRIEAIINQSQFWLIIMNRTAISVLITFTFLLSACSKTNPGPLEGTWQDTGILHTKVHFRNGETEEMGMIEKVEYEVNGNDVIVHYVDGMAKGMAYRYTVVDNNTIKSEMSILHRIE